MATDHRHQQREVTDIPYQQQPNSTALLLVVAHFLYDAWPPCQAMLNEASLHNFIMGRQEASCHLLNTSMTTECKSGSHKKKGHFHSTTYK